VLLVSPRSGSGKSSIAIRLALAAAGGLSANALLVEADLRRPAVARLVGLSPDVGLSTVLSGLSRELEIQAIPLGTKASGPRVRRGTLVPTYGGMAEGAEDDHVVGQRAGVKDRFADYAAPSARELSILPAGAPSNDAAALLGSETMRNLLRIWAKTYDVTVIDGPPAEHVADMIPLATHVDAVVVVARLGADTAWGVRRLQSELERVGVRPVGIVANFARQAKNQYAP
jgi:Mrp family chromosome partitioning ATPase